LGGALGNLVGLPPLAVVSALNHAAWMIPICALGMVEAIYIGLKSRKPSGLAADRISGR
jgi:hypothetical protein